MDGYQCLRCLQNRIEVYFQMVACKMTIKILCFSQVQKYILLDYIYVPNRKIGFILSFHMLVLKNTPLYSSIDTPNTNICPLVTILQQNIYKKQNVIHSLPTKYKYLSQHTDIQHTYIYQSVVQYSIVQQWRRSHPVSVQSGRSLGSCSYTETI